MKIKKEIFAEKLHNKDLFMHIIPDPLLYQKTEDVNVFDDEIINIVSDMKTFMKEYDGVGLAGNQIGIMKSIITIMPKEDDFTVLINPRILNKSKEKCDMEEGCLSIPNVFYTVSRSKNITVTYQDEYGFEKTETFDEVKARIILHEIDHLNGIVFIDHLSMLKRQIVERKFKKLESKALL